MSTYCKKFLVFVFSVNYFLGATVLCQDQDQKAAVLGSNATLTCVISVNQAVRWVDDTNGKNIYTLTQDGQSVKHGDASGDKYNRYFAELTTPTEYSLIITAVEVSDNGNFVCEMLVDGSEIIQYDLTVEAKVTSLAIGCASPCNKKDEIGRIEVEMMTDCQCTCTGIGGYPDSLTLEWNKEVAGPQTREVTAVGPSGTFDFTRTVDFTTMPNYSPLECQVIGYTVQSIKESSDIVEQVSFNILYAPVCTLSFRNDVKNDGCTVMLNCTCVANPDVPAGNYSYFNGDVPFGGNETTITANFNLETETKLSCSGSNVVGTSQQSTAVPYKCSTSTTSSTATEMAPPPSPTKGSSSIWWISIPIVAVVVLICVGVAWWYFKIRDDKPPKSIGAVTATTGDTTSSAPVYGVIDKSKKKKSDKTDGNGMQMSDAPEYAAVSKPLNSEPKPAPRSSQPPPTNSTEKQELQYADIDHSNRTPSNQIRQPAEEPTEYATVQSSVIV